MFLPTRFLIALLSINAFLLQSTLSAPINETINAHQASAKSLPLRPRLNGPVHRRDHAIHRPANVLSMRGLFASSDATFLHRRDNTPPEGLAGWDLGETYWAAATKNDNLYRPSIPDGTPTGKETTMSEEEKQKLQAEEAKEKANSEETEGCEQSEAIEENPTEQDNEEWTTDEGSWKEYEYDHTDDQGQVTQRSFGTGPVLGAGGYGTVYAGIIEVPGSDDIQVAAKTAKKERYGGALITGGGFQKKACKNSVNIVPVEDYFWIPSTGASFLLMPFQDGGDFVDHITTYNAQGQTAVNKAILQALGGLKAMHDLGIMHRDLKPANIMVNDGTLLIADFDAATDQEKASQWLVGTPGFLPPEILRLQPYDKNSDVFSMGMTWIYTSFSKIWPWDQQEAFWKALMGPRNGHDFLTPRDVKGLLIEWFDMDKDMKALAADVLCGPEKRIDAGTFYTRLEDLIKNAA